MLTPYDESWPAAAEGRMADLRRVLDPLAEDVLIDHIGSTSVPGLAAKPMIDLQVRMPRIPDPGRLDPALATIGFFPEPGSRPDSPGVHRDHPRGSEQVPDEVWEKRLFTASSPVSVLHVRRSDSPWGRHTVLFRDWLRAHPEERDVYARTKRGLADAHGGDPDHDDYTRAKTAYFDRVQPAFEQWGLGCG
jgi:GrpB-like predicted nucleotidyltransferase (UPF0157 family)